MALQMFRKSVGLDRTVESISAWGLSYGYGDREMDMVCLILIRGGNVVRSNVYKLVSIVALRL